MGLRAVQVWLYNDGLLLWGDAGSCIRFVLSRRTFLLSLTREPILICMQKKSSDLFSKQQSVWQFTTFIKHYMVEFSSQIRFDFPKPAASTCCLDASLILLAWKHVSNKRKIFKAQICSFNWQQRYNKRATRITHWIYKHMNILELCRISIDCLVSLRLYIGLIWGVWIYAEIAYWRHHPHVIITESIKLTNPQKSRPQQVLPTWKRVNTSVLVAPSWS